MGGGRQKANETEESHLVVQTKRKRVGNVGAGPSAATNVRLSLEPKKNLRKTIIRNW